MRTLSDAWTWYHSNRNLLNMMKRLGERYWSELPWDGKLGNDDNFRLLEGDEVAGQARGVLAEFDDLAIFVIFSVFESIVRRELAEDLQTEIDGLQHPALQRSAARMLQNIAEGSFSANVLDLFKRDGRESSNQPTNSLIEEVSRVRRYRNWVAHGRRDADQPERLNPKNAYDTLQTFLDSIHGLADASK